MHMMMSERGTAPAQTVLRGRSSGPCLLARPAAHLHQLWWSARFWNTSCSASADRSEMVAPPGSALCAAAAADARRALLRRRLAPLACCGAAAGAAGKAGGAAAAAAAPVEPALCLLPPRLLAPEPCRRPLMTTADCTTTLALRCLRAFCFATPLLLTRSLPSGATASGAGSEERRVFIAAD